MALWALVLQPPSTYPFVRFTTFKPWKGAAMEDSSGGMAWRLAEILESSVRHSGSQLTLIALDPARRHFAAEWPRVMPKVHAIIEGTLRKHLGDGNKFKKIDNLSYVLAIPDEWRLSLQPAMEAISNEISHRIMGERNQKILVRLSHISLVEGKDGDNTGSSSAPREGGSPSAILKAGNIERILAHIAGAEERLSLEKLAHVLEPICSTEAFQLVASHCLPVLTLGEEPPRRGYGVLPLDPTTDLVAEMDALTAEFAARQLGLLNYGELVIPVHRQTLASRKFRELYLRVCRGLLHLHKDRITFDIHGIEEGTPANRVTEFVQWLRPFAHAVAATVSTDFSTLQNLAGTGLVSIGADLAQEPIEGLEQRLNRFVSRIRGARTRSHVHNVANGRISTLCLALKIDWIDGDLPE